MQVRRRTLKVVVIALLSLTGVFGYSVVEAQPASATEEFCPLGAP